MLAAGRRTSQVRVSGRLGERELFCALGATAAWRIGGGTSLDNTLRVGHAAHTEWVLLQLDPHLALGGYGHGTAHVWSPDGTLMATASQTAALLVLD